VSVINIDRPERFADQMTWPPEFKNGDRRYVSLHFALDAVGNSLRPAVWPTIQRYHRSAERFQFLLFYPDNGFVDDEFVDQLELAFAEFDRKTDARWSGDEQRYIVSTRWRNIAEQVVASLPTISDEQREAFDCATTALGNAFAKGELKSYRSGRSDTDSDLPSISVEAWYGRPSRRLARFARGLINGDDQNDEVEGAYEIMVDAAELEQMIAAGVWLTSTDLRDRIEHEIRRIDQLWAAKKDAPTGTGKAPGLRDYVLNQFPAAKEIYEEVWRDLSAKRTLHHFGLTGKRPILADLRKMDKPKRKRASAP
jgi:hypothetical protein